jgi:hypothetical protein
LKTGNKNCYSKTPSKNKLTNSFLLCLKKPLRLTISATNGSHHFCEPLATQTWVAVIDVQFAITTLETPNAIASQLEQLCKSAAVTAKSNNKPRRSNSYYPQHQPTVELEAFPAENLADKKVLMKPL